jgi:hypothetical protein
MKRQTFFYCLQVLSEERIQNIFFGTSKLIFSRFVQGFKSAWAYSSVTKMPSSSDENHTGTREPAIAIIFRCRSRNVRFRFLVNMKCVLLLVIHKFYGKQSPRHALNGYTYNVRQD